MGRLTEKGHHALLHYRLFQDQTDLDRAIECFEQAQDISPSDHPNRSAVLFNVANAKLIHCQVNTHDVGLDEPITYRDALHLRSSGHPDHVATTLELSLALLIRSQRRRDETDRTEATDLLSRMVELSLVEGGAYQAGPFALEMADVTASMQYARRCHRRKISRNPCYTIYYTRMLPGLHCY